MFCTRFFCPVKDKIIITPITGNDTKYHRPPTPPIFPPNPSPEIRHEILADDDDDDYKDIPDANKLSVVKNDELRRRSGVVPRPVTFDETKVKDLPKHKKETQDEELIKEAVQKNEFLSNITKEGKRLENLINAMYFRKVERDEVIIKQGDIGTKMYVSAKGTYEVSIEDQGVVQTFSDVRVFGELALLYSAERLATIKSCTPGEVYVLDQEDYMNIMIHTNLEEQEEKMSLLLKVKHINSVKPKVLQAVSKLLKIEFFKAGDVIVKEGDKGDKFYIIRAGHVSVTKEKEGNVNTLKQGDYFGERALLKGGIREATVTAEVPVECLTLTRKYFEAHFGNIQEWGDINVEESKKISIHQPQMEYADVELEDFNIIATLGVGGFGRVELVQHKSKSKLIFALKYLKKIDILQQQQKEHVLNEKAVQTACHSMFIVRMYRTYKDNKYLYFLMESCLGGDLWNLLQKQHNRRFQEVQAKFIAACVLESITYLHARQIVYRDLKPENLMIDKHGYVKLTDFGFAKNLELGKKSYTFAGTPEYVAPEIVLNRGHDRSVDYWAFGIFIFELLTGQTPFRTGDPNHMKTYNRILRGIDSANFPSYVQMTARHIIKKLCRPLPSERLGCLRGGIKDIKTHRWFLGFDWDKLNNKKIHSDFVPKLKHPTDTSSFDKFSKEKDYPPVVKFDWEDEF